jgi:uncharacterized membrane protein YdjX (TVP38/TMEM64 family)
MPSTVASIRPDLTWSHWKPAVRTGAWVVVLFVIGMLLTRAYAVPLRTELAAHALAGAAIFALSAIVAVLLPMLTNLPLVPVAVLAYGAPAAAALLLAGWLVGAMLAFAIGRHARETILRRFPSVMRHAQIERLIDPRQRLLSLTLLRMTFPVDLLSYALGLFSPQTGWRDNLLSTALGAAPFALLFAWFPTLDVAQQALLFGLCALAFAGWSIWVLCGGQRDAH